MIVCGRHYATGQPTTWEISGGRFVAVEPTAQIADGHGNHSDSSLWIAPGLVDLQVNGLCGREFTQAELTPQDVCSITLSLAASGVLWYCPTLTTHSDEVLYRALGTVALACEDSPRIARHILGVHLEGPYISPEDGPRGAHPKEFVRPPSWDHFQALQTAARGRIRIVTLSPEYDEAPEFIRRAARSGVVVAIGHTRATTAQIAAAVAAGARFSTHLGNGAHAMLPRHPNYLWDQLAEDRLWASLITDGHHLPASVVKTMLRTKGLSRCLLVSDITGLGGKPPGRYSSGLGEVEVLEDGRLVVAGQRQFLAGAAFPLTTCVSGAMKLGEISLAEAWNLASRQPLHLLGLSPNDLGTGDAASFVRFRYQDGTEPKIEVESAWLEGEPIGKSP